ncbi:uncharacterized protein LOC123011226 isoform X1 [Tribolium madens]|uniref:uncharacterized protein LOC123011226 isoform X1 n=1 Tax=Tribolium madens TaxID=41895 RepID=UPI001CF74262|nr:uncharacterized protein LOC123011226 isoform X1 [Tribolium madens]
MAIREILVFVVFCYLEETSGHGMMLEPINRASLWRLDWKQPSNYNDMGYFCGGVKVQYEQNGGKCGVCGDNYADPVPRSNENTGKFGNGVVSKTYKAGSVVTTSITLTANHLGSFTYSLCVLEDPTKPETEDCFVDLPLADGSSQHPVSADEYQITNQVQLPAGVICDRCVLRWHYKSGNSWGICTDGTQKMGCGAQETFRSCADIAIVS